jgi:hypothetical protein
MRCTLPRQTRRRFTFSGKSAELKQLARLLLLAKPLQRTSKF